MSVLVWLGGAGQLSVWVGGAGLMSVGLGGAGLTSVLVWVGGAGQLSVGLGGLVSVEVRSAVCNLPATSGMYDLFRKLISASQKS